MSGMPDFEAGQLVSAVKQLNKDVESLTRTMTKLNDRLAAQEIQLAGLSSYIMNKI